MVFRGGSAYGSRAVSKDGSREGVFMAAAREWSVYGSHEGVFMVAARECLWRSAR
jgi:hypothetical protein